MPNYILLRPSGYYFRYALPKSYAHLLSTRELRYTLATNERRTAKKLAREIVCRIEALLRELAGGAVTLTETQIRDTIRAYVEEAREDIEAEAISKRRTPAMQEAYVGVLVDDIAAYDYAAGHADYRGIAPQVAKLFGVDLAEAASVEGFHRACREWAIATAELRRYNLRLLKGKPTKPASRNNPTHHTTGTHAGKPKRPPISLMVEPFIENRVKSRGLRENSQENYRQHVRAFVDVIGDKAVDAVTYEDSCRFRDDLLRLPKNRNSNPVYREISVASLLAMDIPAKDRLSGRTVAEHLTSLRAIFAWLTVRREITHNPFETVGVPYESESYAQYTLDDLDRIFSSELYQPDSAYANKATTTAGQWWLPLLALYTGARPSELVQLRLDDIRESEGSIVLAISDREEGQEVKTAAGRRELPAHRELVRLGIADYIRALREQGAQRLLQGVALGKRKAGDQGGKWYNERYRTEQRLPGFKEARKTLYSFRHTHITQALNVAKVEMRTVQQWVGHERTQMGATRYYDKGAAIPQLQTALNRLTWDSEALRSLGRQWEDMPLFR